MNPDSRERYGSITRFFHWSMAFLLGWQLLKLLDRIDEGEHWVGQNLVSWHVSVGALILLLVVPRIIWALKQKNQRPEHEPATAFWVRSGHFLLYACMALMPITGILAMIGNGHGLNAFGVQWVAEGGEIAWMATLGSLHSPIAWLLLVLIIGHVFMALLHHFVKRDGVLQRML